MVALRQLGRGSDLRRFIETLCHVQSMDEFKEIDYKGIGEGLSTTGCGVLSPSDSIINLSDDGQELSSNKGTWCEHRFDPPAEKSAEDTEPETNSYLAPAATAQGAQLVASNHEQNSQSNLTPLVRYCCDAQTHEQLAVGLIPERRSLNRPNGLDESLGAAVELLIGPHSEVAASSCSTLGSNPGGEPSIAPAVELDGLLHMKDSPEWQAVPQDEQEKCLHRIANLKRRIRAEDNPRKMSSVRVRKRSRISKSSDGTVEA
ncbi:hypothetical protein HD806DRAFT_525264 [Xylariaceae sp. AK1471]|nr:hypothetical protein HD806DRAFT_525264 [Xylariaceae sp. AK1471]